MLSKNSVKSAVLSVHGSPQRKRIARFLLTWILVGLAGLAGSIYLTGSHSQLATTTVFTGPPSLPSSSIYLPTLLKDK